MTQVSHQLSRDPMPHKKSFWFHIVHHGARAKALAKCFPEYWLREGMSDQQAAKAAERCLAVLSGKSLPPDRRGLIRKLLFLDRPPSLYRLEIRPPKREFCPDHLPQTDPVHWVHAGETLETAVERAVAAHAENFERACTLTPIAPEFWQCIGLSKDRSLDIVRCLPEYWLAQGRPAADAESTATYCQVRVQGYLLSSWSDDRRAGGLIKTAPKKLPARQIWTRTDPLYLASWEDDFAELVDNAIYESGVVVDDSWRTPLKLGRVLGDCAKDAKRLQDGAIYVQGACLGDQAELLANQNEASTSDEHDTGNPRWGPLTLTNPSDANAHFCTVGTTRSGKTVLLSLLMQSLRKHRLFVYDNKTNLVSTIHGMRPNEEFLLFNPLDMRCVALDMAKDAADPSRPPEMGRALIPDDRREKPYFIQTVRTIVTAGIQALNHIAPGGWRFHHLLAAFEAKHIRTVLCSCEATRDVYETHLNRPHGTPSDLQSSLESRLAPYKPIAAAWRHADKCLSIGECLEHPGTIIIGNDETHKAAIGPLNRLLMGFLCEGLFERAQRSPQRTALFLDELEDLGRIDSLVPLLNRGAGLNVTVVLGFHDIETLTSIFGEATRGIVSMCGNYAFLKTNSPATARWASEVLGTQEVVLRQEQHGAVGEEESRSASMARVERPLVTPTEIQQLPLTTRESGLNAYFKSPGMSPYLGSISGDELFGDLLPPPSPVEQNFIPRPKEHFIFPEDTTALLAEIGIGSEDRSVHKVGASFTTDPAFDPAKFPRIETE